MPTFKDAQQREWTINLNRNEIRRLQDKGVDLLEFAEKKFEKFHQIQQDEIAFLDLLWLIIEPQATTIGVTQQDFEKELLGEHMDAAQEVFNESFLASTRNPEIRSALKRILDRGKEQTTRMMLKVTEQAETLMTQKAAEMEAKIPEMFAEILTTQEKSRETSTALPVPSA